METSRPQTAPGHVVAPSWSASRRRLHRGLENACLAMLYAVPVTVTWTVAGVHIALGMAAAFGIALGFLRRDWPLARTAADSAFVAFATASCLTVVFAHDAAASAMPLKKLLLIPSVHLAAAVLARPHRARTALRFFVFTAAATALVSSIVFLVERQGAFERLETTTHYMTWSGLLLLATPMAAAATLGATRRWRVAYVAATVVLGWALLLTQTRSAWLGMVIAAVAVLARIRPRRLWLVPVAGAIIIAVVPSEFRARAMQSFDLTHHATEDRLFAWKAGGQMWLLNPISGVGLGDLQALYREFVPGEKPYGHLHNNWIHIFASMGTLGLIAFAWLMLRFGQIVWRAGVATSAHAELHALALGAWGSFWGFQVMGLFEWNFGDVEVTITLYFLLGTLLAATRCFRVRTEAVS